MAQSINQTMVVACVEEFYATVAPERRHTLDRLLNEFKTAYPCPEVIFSCIGLMDRANSATVQLFGAISLYETVKHRSEECISHPNLMEQLKQYLIDSLTSSAGGRSHAVIQKLQATLALLVLYSIPDVWAQPVQDLTLLWSAIPELLLRVLAEIAAEFLNVHMPLTQRSVLKTELHRISEEIILVITTVLNAQETDPSLRQAAVECVEKWVELPGIGLEQWTKVLSNVFGAVIDDNAALTSLLNILADNEELSNLEQLVLDICGYITNVTAKKIETELRENSDSVEASTLVAAVCRLSERAVPNLIRDMRSNPNSASLVDICSMCVTLSNWPGRYPVEECISDLPAVFWTFLRESLQEKKSLNDQKISEVINAVKPMYIQILREAITKMSYPPITMLDTFDKEQKELFIMYRKNRSEISVDAFCIVGNDVLIFLNQELAAAIKNGDICRTESILNLWSLVADYLTEEQNLPICQCLELCNQLSKIPTGKDCDRLGCTLMQLFFALTHIIQAHENSIAIQTFVIKVILPYMDRSICAFDALTALENIVSMTNPDLFAEIGNEVSEKCYNFFMDCTNSEKLRLLSLKCIGYILSTKETAEVMEIVQRMIAVHVQDLTTTDLLTEDEIRNRQFQISIFSSLFSTLQNKNRKNSENSPVTLILEQAVPVFRSILANQGVARAIGDRVCEAVRSAVCSFPEDSPSICNVFSSIAEIIDMSLVTNTTASCSLAKSTVLTYAKSNSVAALCDSIARWFGFFEANQEHNEKEEWLGLMYHIIKKNRKVLQVRPEQFSSVIKNAIHVAGNAVISSEEPAVVRIGAQVLAEISSQTMSYGDDVTKNLLAENGAPLVKNIFLRVQNELIRTTVESLAEILFFFVTQFPAETRSVISSEERGDSPIVTAMLGISMGNLRHFKQMTIRLNQACRKSS